MSEEPKAITMDDFFKPRAAPVGWTMAEIAAALAENKIVKFREVLEWNIDKVYNCITIVQVKEVIDQFWKKEIDRATDWYTPKGNICYDGMVFSITRGLYDRSRANPDDYDLKLHYVSHFGYVGDGNFLSFIDKENIHKSLSKYPLFRDMTDEEYKAEFGRDRNAPLFPKS